MCLLAGLGALGALGLGGAAAGATAAGATAAAGGFGATLQTIGTIAGVAGSIAQGVQGYKASKAQADYLSQQAQTEAQLTAVREDRSRQKFRSLMATQRAGVAARGLSLDSPTAVFLGQTAAQEMVYEAQTIRQGGQATQTELSNSKRLVQAQGQTALLKGGFSAAGTMLTAAPKLWPGLLS